MSNKLASRLVAYESGELDEQETLELFEELVQTGLAWQLQGHYGRTAMYLIETGEIADPSAAPARPARDREELVQQLWPVAEDIYVEHDRRYREGWAISQSHFESSVSWIARMLADIELLPLTDEEDTR